MFARLFFYCWVSDRSLVCGFDGGWASSPRCPAHLFETLCLLLRLQRRSAGNVGSWMVRAEPGQGHACLLVAWFLLPLLASCYFPAHSRRVCVLRNESLQALLISAHALVFCGILLLRRSFCFLDCELLPPSPSFLQLAALVEGCEMCRVSWLSSFPGLPTAMGGVRSSSMPPDSSVSVLDIACNVRLISFFWFWFLSFCLFLWCFLKLPCIHFAWFWSGAITLYSHLPSSELGTAMIHFISLLHCNWLKYYISFWCGVWVHIFIHYEIMIVPGYYLSL